MRQLRQQQQWKQQQQMHQRQRELELKDQVERQAGAEAPEAAAATSSKKEKGGGSSQTTSKAKRRPKQVHPEEEALDPEEFERWASEHSLQASWRPQVALLHSVGLRPADFGRLADVRPELFQTAVPTMRRKLDFLREEAGLSAPELAKAVTKFPRLLEYEIDRTLRPRLAFLRSCGVPAVLLGKVVARAPMLMSLSLADTLAPRAEFLRREIGLPDGAGGLGKLIARHPQALTCSEDMLRLRVHFLREQGLTPTELRRAVLAHPQVLHYKVESMRQRLDWLRGVGLGAGEVAEAVARFPQLFSLSIAANMAPKWRYLVEHLGGGPAALRSYPGYMSLSLTNRIIPRHRYLLELRGDACPCPFPLGHLKLSDEAFATSVAGTNLEAYEAFREQLEEEAEEEQERLQAAGRWAEDGAANSGESEEVGEERQQDACDELEILLHLQPAVSRADGDAMAAQAVPLELGLSPMTRTLRQTFPGAAT